jgi:hypothetical protein
MLHENAFQIINIYSISGQNHSSELLWHSSYCRGGVNQVLILKIFNDLLSIYKKSLKIPLR